MEIQEREVLARVESTSSKLDIALAIAEADALDAWRKYKVTEPLGIDFGKKMYVLRTKLSARGKEGKGFSAWLEKNHIPHSTAYFWIEKYEVAEGLRGPAPVSTLPDEYAQAAMEADIAQETPDANFDAAITEALALPDATELNPKREYAPDTRRQQLRTLADKVGERFGICTVKPSTVRDGLAVSTGMYNCELKLVGVSRQRLLNALNALVDE
jgi:hypothetical protein